MYFHIKRVHEAKIPFNIYLEAGNDWTHFLHLHRKSHALFQLLYKSGGREIFLYKTRVIYPFPIYNTFIVFREQAPEQAGYKQLYINIKNGRRHFLSSKNEELEDRVRGTTEFWFDVPAYWGLAPKLFFRLALGRMKAVADEDDVMMRERMEHGAYSRPACTPDVPPAFDFYHDVMEKGAPKAEHSFSASFFVDTETREQHRTA